ncbi:PREDICTED: protein LEG1 homolog [Propithecus coquereli]|uniref:protein LEG1 homolog n=1 Tax=Propithecus coquereli TaxID=379532 RepID=UPI00063F7547|nr:PREDICTED: protein LEG1 homolog [Propithecus coquereli]
MAFLPSWVHILVGCFSASLAWAPNLSYMEPPLWKESPGQFSDYRVENGVYIVDPWVFPERMGLYKILLNQTARYFEKFAPENEQNILWGLPLQHGWQYSSGHSLQYDYYSKPEARFERKWPVAVGYIGASLFPTTLTATYNFQKGLPPRVLVNTDVVPFISDFTAFQNIVLFILNMLDNAD